MADVGKKSNHSPPPAEPTATKKARVDSPDGAASTTDEPEAERPPPKKMYELWRDPAKSINSYGEPFSAWASERKDGKWYVVYTLGSPDEGPGRQSKVVSNKPAAHTERHVVSEDQLSMENWDDDEELDYHTSGYGRHDTLKIEDRKEKSRDAVPHHTDGSGRAAEEPDEPLCRD